MDIFEKRHSVRSFKNQDVPDADIKKMLKAAGKAPSGKNIQNWHFVVIKNQEKIEKIAKIIAEKNKFLAKYAENEKEKSNFKKYLKFSTHFKDAPVLILAYAGKYSLTGLELMKKANLSQEEINKTKNAAPGIQNLAAAFENMLLKAAELGYGSCWMTSQNYAIKEIEEFIDLDKDGYNLAIISPIGIPKEQNSSPKKKELNEFVSWLK